MGEKVIYRSTVQLIIHGDVGLVGGIGGEKHVVGLKLRLRFKFVIELEALLDQNLSNQLLVIKLNGKLLLFMADILL